MRQVVCCIYLEFGSIVLKGIFFIPVLFDWVVTKKPLNPLNFSVRRLDDNVFAYVHLILRTCSLYQPGNIFLWKVNQILHMSQT